MSGGGERADMALVPFAAGGEERGELRRCSAEGERWMESCIRVQVRSDYTRLGDKKTRARDKVEGGEREEGELRRGCQHRISPQLSHLIQATHPLKNNS